MWTKLWWLRGGCGGHMGKWLLGGRDTGREGVYMRRRNRETVVGG